MFLPVVTAQEMQRLEKLAIDEGACAELFMKEAARNIAAVCLEYSSESKKVSLLIGKGNNGGDAYVVGLHLLEKGVSVTAWTICPLSECSKLNQKFHQEFIAHGGKCHEVENANALCFDESGFIVDGFLGTGFSGKVEGKMAIAILQANASQKPIIAIDIPSGVGGTTGEVCGPAIFATETVCLGFYKSGLFLRNGYNYVGKLHLVNFGLDQKYVAMAQSVSVVVNRSWMHPHLPKIVRNRHKYQAGYVLGFSGSKVLKGAPKMAGLSALRAGAGIVRVMHQDDIGEIPDSLICQIFDEKVWKKELLRASAVFLGPGVGQSLKMRSLLKRLLKKINVPLVIDADAIQTGLKYPEGSILTPHRGEVLRLLKIEREPLEEDLLQRCQKWVNKTHCILILKGGPTCIFSKGRDPILCPYGDSGMAKAGTGDVLTGVIAALLAQKMSPLHAAIFGVLLHARTGEMGAQKYTSYGMIAEDLISLIPCCIREVASGGTP